MCQLKNNLTQIENRIEKACQKACRPAADITVLAASKGQTASRMAQLYQLGVHRFGENYLQEARGKQRDLAKLPIEWHFIGPVQSNKTLPIALHFDWLQSLARVKILRRLAAQRPSDLPPLNVLLEINIDREPQKSGMLPEQLPELTALIDEFPNIRLRGLMAIPKADAEPDQRRAAYDAMKQLYDELAGSRHGIDTLSMGMSDDLELAIECGSTMVRIGSALLGPRPTRPLKEAD